MDPDGGLIGAASGLPRRRRRLTSKRQPQPQPEEDFQPVVSDVLNTAGAAARAGDDEGDDGSSTDGSIPAVPPAKRGPSSTRGPRPPKRQAKGPDRPIAFAFEQPPADDAASSAEGAKLVQLKRMVRTMEEEFREVLRGEQEKHEQELSSARAAYETDLREQRERYEARIDDLIKILSSTMASKS